MRLPGWETILDERIRSARHMPFAWGRHDCATWAVDVRSALTGADNPADEWRGRYSTRIGCARLMRQMGVRSIEAGARALLGMPRPSPLMAQRGDVVMVAGAAGICIGAHGAFVGPAGLRFVWLRECSLAWEI